MVDETVKVISICGFEGMCARVAQWWSIALPRRGSRVRIPSRALKEIEKRVIRWMALFSMFKPCRVRTVRMSPLRCGRRRRTSPGRSATSRALDDTKKEIFVGYLLFLACSSLVVPNGSKVSALPRACRTADMSASFPESRSGCVQTLLSWPPLTEYGLSAYLWGNR